MTLLEVVFVSAILGLFVLMVARALVMGFRAHQRTMDRSYHYRQGAVALSRLVREISVCILWVSPGVNTGISHPIADGDLIFMRTNETYSRGAGPPHEVRYWRDVNTQELIRKDSTLPGGKKAVVGQVLDFSVEPVAGSVKVSLTIKNNGVPLVVVGQPIRM